MRLLRDLVFIFVIVALGTPSALGQASVWIKPPPDAGNWFDSANWSAGVPGSGDAEISNAGTATIAAGVVTPEILTLERLSAHSGFLQLQGGSLSFDSSFSPFSLRIGDAGQGTVLQSGGTCAFNVSTAMCLGYQATGAGT
jgi:hypothetical protein